MSVMRALRAWHALLAALVVLAYLTGELGALHAWLGYAIAALIPLRLVAALTGLRPLGLERFYPDFEGLRLDNSPTHPAITRSLLAGIALCVIAATVTGILLDGGAGIGLGAAPAGHGGEHEGGLLGGAHEALANLLMLAVGLHVAYLLLFKRPLARFMLFLDAGGGKGRAAGS